MAGGESEGVRSVAVHGLTGIPASPLQRPDVNASQPGIAWVAVEALVPIQRHLDPGKPDGRWENLDVAKLLHGLRQPAGTGGDEVGDGNQCHDSMEVRNLHHDAGIDLAVR